MRFEPPKPSLELLFRVQAELGAPQEIGVSGLARRRVIPITGGTFDGPELKGRILPGGADWQLVNTAGSAFVDARYTLETENEQLIYVNAVGIRHGPTEVLKALAAGEDVDPRTYYFRTAIRFETSGEDLQWLNTLFAVGSGIRLANAVIYDAFAVR